MKKLTKEDIKKYATEDEKKTLNEILTEPKKLSWSRDADKDTLSDIIGDEIGEPESSSYLKINISMNTDAFAENPKAELKRILTLMAKNIDRLDGINFMAIPDKNGKPCGTIEYNLPK